MLYNFLRCINGNYKITRKKVKLNGKEFGASRLGIYSIKMCKDLINLGCIPAKSLILKPPTCVPEIYINAFIRGIFDGDGHFGYYVTDKSRNIDVDFAGNYEMLSWIKDILYKNGVNSSNVKKDPRANVYRLCIYDRHNIANFYNYLYNDCSYILDRKKELFEQTMKKVNIPIKRGWVAQHADELDG
jgi:hypothetical protein